MVQSGCKQLSPRARIIYREQPSDEAERPEPTISGGVCVSCILTVIPRDQFAVVYVGFALISHLYPPIPTDFLVFATCGFSCLPKVFCLQSAKPIHSPRKKPKKLSTLQSKRTERKTHREKQKYSKSTENLVPTKRLRFFSDLASWTKSKHA